MKAHRTDVVSFAFGLVFLALAVWWLLARILGLTVPPVGWFLAGALILVGLLGLLGALRSGRHTDREPAHQPPDTTVAAPYEAAPTSGPPTGQEADEWATDAVTDIPAEARADRPVDEEPHWSSATALSEPATAESRDGGSAPVTRELPTVDHPEWPAGQGPATGPRT